MKGNLVRKGQKVWLECLLLLSVNRFVSNELRYLAEEMSEVWRMWPGFSLLLMVKCSEDDGLETLHS